jgi:hypothetical protein
LVLSIKKAIPHYQVIPKSAKHGGEASAIASAVSYSQQAQVTHAANDIDIPELFAAAYTISDTVPTIPAIPTIL